jgi:hypothetical protein
MVCSRNANGYAITSQNYFSQLEGPLHRELPSASRSSFCEARQKLHWKAFEFLLRESNLKKAEISESYKWKGHVVRAADGTKITLPHSKKVIQEFPQRKATKSPEGTFSHYPFAQLVSACNVMTGQPSAARLYDLHGSEREGVLSMVKEDFEAGDICLLDRGLGGIRVWRTFDDNHQFHVTRLRESKRKGPSGFQYVHEFLRSKKSEITLERQLVDPKTKEIILTRIRIIRGNRLKDGSFLVIGTNLLDRNRYPAKDLLELYARRWNVESMYYRVKTLLNVQAFHARQPNGILQEIFANLLILSMTSVLGMHASQIAGLDQKKVCPNLKNATEVLKRNLFFCVTSVHKNEAQRREWAQKITQEVLRVLCKKQPGRSYPRYSRQPMNRWGYAKANKIKLFNQGRRCNEGADTRRRYTRKN